jgi:hypothetical protein
MKSRLPPDPRLGTLVLRRQLGGHLGQGADRPDGARESCLMRNSASGDIWDKGLPGRRHVGASN